tara:strand:+ start:1476 stop:1664 length:189 start_codon:yes stop_codon:yes gene_type:complete
MSDELGGLLLPEDFTQLQDRVAVITKLIEEGDRSFIDLEGSQKLRLEWPPTQLFPAINNTAE